jgi:large subunit ribosomal protein L22
MITARLRYLRIAPRKVRLVADMIRGKKVEKAQNILNFSVQKPALPLLKLLNQAVASAKNDFQIESGNLFVSRIFVDEGPKQKRWMPRARGQAYEIQKKTSHITLVLDEIVKGKSKKVEKKVVEKKAAPEKPEEGILKPEKPKFKKEEKSRKLQGGKGFARIFRRKSI